MAHVHRVEEVSARSLADVDSGAAPPTFTLAASRAAGGAGPAPDPGYGGDEVALSTEVEEDEAPEAPHGRGPNNVEKDTGVEARHGQGPNHVPKDDGGEGDAEALHGRGPNNVEKDTGVEARHGQGPNHPPKQEA